MSDHRHHAPRVLVLSCVGCAESRNFTITDADVDELLAEYECPECDHRAVIDLDPQ